MEKDKVFCKECKHYEGHLGIQYWCGNEDMWLVKRTPIERKVIKDCERLNRFNKCEGYEAKEKEGER